MKSPIIPLEPLDPVSMDTIKSLLATCTRGKLADARDKASLMLLLDTGVRRAEFLSLNIGDVNPITGTILIRSGKVESRVMFTWERNPVRLYDVT